MKLLRISVSIIVLFLSTDLFSQEIVIPIIHTNDLHSHLLGFSPTIDYRPDMTGRDATKGGWARIAAVIKLEKEKRNIPLLVLDGGDFIMGSLLHMMAREEPLNSG